MKNKLHIKKPDKSKSAVKIYLFCACCLLMNPLFSQINYDSLKFHQVYKVPNRKAILLPLGELSFADEVIEFKVGSPGPSEKYGTVNDALGPPDYERYPDDTYLSLGCAGQLTVAFRDNGFIDIQGPDPYFFEIGPSVEKFKVEISTNGKQWRQVGTVDGGSSSVDIAPDRDPEDREREIYFYVRVTDMKDFCDGPTAGSDIDAIGTIGGVLRVNIDANLLFKTDKYYLKPGAKERLDHFILGLSKIPAGEIRIEGHTDSRATDDYNIDLSQNRAKSVKNYLAENIQNPQNYKFDLKFFGEKKPVASNEDEEGRQKNRRVEIIVIPDASFYKAPEPKKK